MNKTCGICEKTDGLCYTSNPPKCRCNVTGEFHTYDHECDMEEDNDEPMDQREGQAAGSAGGGVQ